MSETYQPMRTICRITKLKTFLICFIKHPIEQKLCQINYTLPSEIIAVAYIYLMQ